MPVKYKKTIDKQYNMWARIDMRNKDSVVKTRKT